MTEKVEVNTEKKCKSEDKTDQCQTPKREIHQTSDSTIVRRKEKDVVIVTSTENDCEQLMERIYDGNYFLVPYFAQTLISYLYEEMPVSDNPRVLCHHIATRGMNIMSKAHKLGEIQKEKEQQKLQLEDKSNNTVYYAYLRDVSFLSIGVFLSYKYYNTLVLLAYCIYKTCKEYRVTKHTQMIDFMFVIIIAYNLCK